MIREGLQEEVTWEQRDYLGRAHRERDQQEGRSLADAFTEWGGAGGCMGQEGTHQGPEDAEPKRLWEGFG